MQIAIFLQLLWVIVSVFWNISGLDNVEQGQVLPTSLPSWGTILILIGIGVSLYLFHYFKFRALYKLMSLTAAVFAGIAIYHAFLTQPELWNDSSWQWVGVFINIFGLVAGIAGVFARINPKGYRPDPISPFFTGSSESKN